MPRSAVIVGWTYSRLSGRMQVNIERENSHFFSSSLAAVAATPFAGCLRFVGAS
jgi:hypothetical protein